MSSHLLIFLEISVLSAAYVWPTEVQTATWSKNKAVKIGATHRIKIKKILGSYSTGTVRTKFWNCSLN